MNQSNESRKIVVLGATGGTGGAVVAQALAGGHSVTAVVRAPEKMKSTSGLLVVKGDPKNADDLAASFRGADVVVSALGRRDAGDPTLLADCARATVLAMKTAGVERLVVVSAALLFPNVGLVGALLRKLLRAAMADSAQMETIVEASGLTWTIARPPRLTNGAPTGKFAAENEALPAGKRSIARADLATFLLDEAVHPNHVGHIVGVAS